MAEIHGAPPLCQCVYQRHVVVMDYPLLLISQINVLDTEVANFVLSFDFLGSASISLAATRYSVTYQEMLDLDNCLLKLCRFFLESSLKDFF